ncbi:MAG: hypothetical protein ABF904_12660 [Ethanoligenens sp.]
MEILYKWSGRVQDANQYLCDETATVTIYLTIAPPENGTRRSDSVRCLQ